MAKRATDSYAPIDTSGDINIDAYERMERELLEEYPGQYVAFVNGAFAGAGGYRPQLLKHVYAEHGAVEVFVQLVRERSVRAIRTPHRGG